MPIPWEFQISCGTEKIFLFCEIANLAVTLVPLLYTASITRTPRDNPLIIRFLAKKYLDWHFVSGEYSLIINPLLSKIFLYNSLFSSGKIWLNPFPKTAIVLPSWLYEYRWAIVSIPFC